MKDNKIQDYLKESRKNEIDETLESLLNSLKEEGLEVEFGNIGVRTTYARIHDKDDNIEIVGYTFLKDMKYYRENVGKLKALQQALARKEVSKSE